MSEQFIPGDGVQRGDESRIVRPTALNYSTCRDAKRKEEKKAPKPQAFSRANSGKMNHSILPGISN